MRFAVLSLRQMKIAAVAVGAVAVSALVCMGASFAEATNEAADPVLVEVVTASGASSYSSVEQALANCPAGGTVKLRRNCSKAVSVPASSSMTLDLAGYTVSGISISSGSTVSIVSSSSGGRAVGTDTNGACALQVGSGSAVTVKGVDLVAGTSAHACSAVKVEKDASFTATGSNIECATMKGAATCVEATDKASLSFERCALKAFSSARDASVFGISARTEGSSLVFADGSIDVDSCAGMTGGIQVAGDINVTSSRVNVETSAVTSFAWGVRELQKGTHVSVDSCDVEVASADSSAHGSYYCLVSGSAGTLVDAVWSVTGSNSFHSSSSPSTRIGQPDATASHIVNLRTNQKYASLAAAFAQVQAGDTLRLDGDSSSAGSASCAQPCTLDMNGHTLTIDAGKEATASSDKRGGALVFSQTGKVTIENGTLVARLGSNLESSSSASDGYNGLSICGDAHLDISNATVRVRYEGGSTTRPIFDMSGIALSGGTLNMANGSKLVVDSAPAAGTYGASSARGIAVTGGSPKVSVGTGCSVEVHAQSQKLSKGELNSLHGNQNAGSSSLAPLMRIYPAEDGALYKEMQDKFYQNAKLDAAGDTGGYVYGTNIYYVAGIQLDCGYYFWAFSDPVDNGDLGKKEAIVAKYFFVQAIPDFPSSGIGVYASEGSAPEVTLAGAVTCDAQGDAIAVSMQGAGTLQANSADLSARTSGAAYRKETGGFSLSDVISSISSQTSEVVYPKGAVWSQAVLAASVAGKFDVADKVEASGVGGAELQLSSSTENVTSLERALFDKVRVTVHGARNGKGGSRAPVEENLSLGDSLSAVLASAKAAESFTSEVGTEYRLIGWSIRYANNTAVLYSKEAAQRLELGALLGIKNAELSVNAVYAPVPANCHLITYEVTPSLSACTVLEGEAYSYSDSQEKAASEKPVVFETKSNVTFSFKSWEDENGSSSQGESAAASKGKQFTAVFAESGANLTVRLYAWCRGQNGLVFQALKRTIAAGTKLTDLANSVAQVGSRLDDETTTHQLLGWSVRESDLEPMYTEECPATYTSNFTLYGVYENKDRVVDVEFYESGELLGTARGVSATMTISDALWNTGQDKPFDIDADNPFRGWTGTEGSFTPLPDELTSVGSVSNDETIKLYAVFGYQRAMVTFFDSDKKTVVGSINAIVGRTISDITKTIVLPPEKQKVFKGWQTEDGQEFSLINTVVTEPCSVYATYKTAPKLSGGGNTATKKKTSKKASSNNSSTAGKKSTASNDSFPASDGSGITPMSKTEKSEEKEPKPFEKSEDSVADAGEVSSNSDAENEATEAEQDSAGTALDTKLVASVVVGILLVALALLRLAAVVARRRKDREALLESFPQDGKEIRF